MDPEPPAEYTRIVQAGIVAEASARWGLPRDLAEHVGDSESLAFAFGAPPTGVFLRFVSKHRRTSEEIEAELVFQEHLRSRGISVSEPIQSRSGRYVEELGGDDGYWACAFGALPGRHIDWRRDDLDEAVIRLWGAALGRIHRASQEIKGPQLARPRWDEDPIVVRALAGEPSAERAAVAGLRAAAATFAGYEVDRTTFGLIHGDFGFRNFLVEPDFSVHAIDFDDCCYHWYAADIAFALWPARRTAPDRRREILDWFLSGYRRECGIEGIWKARLSQLIRFRTAYLYLLFAGGSWDRVKHPNQPQWLERTRAEFGRPFEW